MSTDTYPLARRGTVLLSLPNELIQLILEPLPIRSLLPLTLTCKRIHGIIGRLIHYRLHTLVSAIGPDNILLECYHPVCKPIGPYLKCAYLHTDVLTDDVNPHCNVFTAKNWHYRPPDSSRFSTTGYLGRLKNSYTHFLPLGPRGPSINTIMSMTPSPRYIAGEFDNNSEQSKNMLIRGSIFLDENELFSQLITGVWLGRQNRQICLLDGGVVRIWRHWLGDMDRHRKFAGRTMSTGTMSTGAMSTGGGHGVCGDGESYYTLKVRSAKNDAEAKLYPVEDRSVVWLGEKRAGLRFRVCHQWRAEGLQFAGDSGSDEVHGSADDDENTPVCYDVEIQELLVQTTTLLLALEKGYCIL